MFGVNYVARFRGHAKMREMKREHTIELDGLEAVVRNLQIRVRDLEQQNATLVREKESLLSRLGSRLNPFGRGTTPEEPAAPVQ